MLLLRLINNIAVIDIYTATSLNDNAIIQRVSALYGGWILGQGVEP